ncbi:Swi3-domain-containing protein [Lentinus tigrinus ALCF2SS1-7]|uniref:Chromosome segregation in meiosis protein n=1 Tax=Lentinus tigrinus ALCF2SS1-6 TaxID=1328759 RepID=A0A5C2SQT0_9APHY|nr:Swi3-domain-containing protein [Lentinus tigrinus ALCF2SS1-6]RPD80103.1 Swi3-domain-containing protein [Lentinus tigrinus ALCF2SS1-7]
MASLADIWDIPAESASSTPAPPRNPPTLDDDDDVVLSNTAKRRPRSTLFLDSDSENEAAPTSSKGAHYASRPSTSKNDIDALFDDLEDEPESTFKQLAPSLDVDALRRQAEAKIALTPHQILPSSSPPRDLGDEEEDGKRTKGGKKAKDGLSKRKRKNLDEGTLVGPLGFPALVKQAKNFKPKGKGHELSDLNRLLNVYHFWSHEMYPNTQFIDTVQRVEKLCHSKRMNVALGVWRDESKGLINGHDVNADGSDHSDSDADNDDAPRPTDVPIATDNERSSPAPSRGPSLPPSSASEADGLDDDFDIDAMIREEEVAQTQGPSGPSTTSAPAPRRAPAATSNTPMDEDEAMWDAMDDFPAEPYVPPDREQAVKKPTAPAPPMDEDEDMWDMIREVEQEREAVEKAAPPTSNAAGPPEGAGAPTEPVTGPFGIVGVDPTRPATNDEGWDEMYA